MKNSRPHVWEGVHNANVELGDETHVLRYIRGDAASDTMDIFTRVDRDEARGEYLDCIKTPNL